MKNLKQAKQFFLVLLVGVLIYSCSQDEQINPQQTENFVNLAEASSIASVIEYFPTSDVKSAKTRGKGVASKFKEVEKVLAVPDNEGNPSYYIINYKDDGFIMISADNRINPIRAYSLTEKFPMESKELPSGLVGWLAESSDMISEIRTLDEKQTQGVAKAWDSCEIQKTLRQLASDDCGGNGNDCEDLFITVGPLLSTKWGQGYGFNDFMPSLNCSPSLPSNKAYAGCTPIAIAQVMKYHNYPTSYNWNNMPDGNGTTTTASFIKDIHDAITVNLFGNEYSAVSYDCGGTGVSRDYDIASIFTDKFGYYSANQGGYNQETVEQQLDWNKPVILSGGRKSGWWIFSSYEGGHMWVCDGYRSSYYCETGMIFLYFHMNWGWDGRYDNWYAYNNFNPNGDTYNYEVKMVYNIEP